MTAVLLAAVVVLTLAAGAVIAGYVTTQLSLLERALVAIVTGLLFGSAFTYALALLAGLSVATVLGGPAVMVAAGGALTVARRSPLPAWRASIVTAREYWGGHVVGACAAAGIAAVAALMVGVIFSRTLFTSGGALESGYATVWADWSQHLTTTASFSVAHNLPPVNPLFSGTALLYPFLADFQSATLMVLGASQPAALAVPSALLVVVAGALVVCLARRLGVGLGGAVAAAVIAFLGGGIGFVGVFADACAVHGFPASHCSVGYIAGHPFDGLGIVGGTLHSLPAAVMAQPRAYDGLPSDGGMALVPGLEWYTPLLAWWLPQRTIVYGFAAALTALLLVYAAVDSPLRRWSAFALAGALIGLLPIVHIQTLIALTVLLLVIGMIHRRREWLGLVAIAAVFAAPRLVQVAAAPHGSAADGNAYPWFEPGWLANTPAHLDVSVANAFLAVGQGIRELFTPQWWGFWTANLGLVVPLCAVLLLAAATSFAPGPAGLWGRRITGVVPRPLFELFLAAMLLFAVCNVVVFQSWDWDNTKLFVYWYLVVGLVAGAMLTRVHRHLWRSVTVSALLVTMLLTGVLVMVRFGPWTPPADQVGGPYTIADAQERTMAATVAASTPHGAVFLTFGTPNDPLLAVAGRTSLMGYYGWLWSYGTVFGSRQVDVQTMYAGCEHTTSCSVYPLLHRYNVSFVEVDDRITAPGAVTTTVGVGWWAQQGLPVVARTEHIVVYDVRGVT